MFSCLLRNRKVWAEAVGLFLEPCGYADRSLYREEAGANTDPLYDFHGVEKSLTLGSSFLIQSLLWVSYMVALPLPFWP